VATSKATQQVQILKSGLDRLDSILADIHGVLDAQIIDGEIDVARELSKAHHYRSAGVIAGVVLERHLRKLISDHKVPFRKKPMLGNLNEALKEAGIYGVPEWRRIQHLTDLRNLCAHDSDRDPTEQDAVALIDGAAALTKTLF
jgi:hypothetical protein